MNELPLGLLLVALVVLIIISGFFSGSETGLMALNKYRLRHLVRDKHAGAMRAHRLLEHPDRLISLILLGNNAVNIMITLLAAIIMLRMFGELSVFVSTVILTFIMVLFAEVTPKTLAALHPERFAFPATWILNPLMRIGYPVVWFFNKLMHGIFKIFRIDSSHQDSMHLSPEELRTVVIEAGSMIPRSHQDMLLSILDLEQVSVDDIMVPRGEIVGIDIEDDWQSILDQLYSAQHTRLPVYRGDINHVIGIVHLRRTIKLLTEENFSRETLLEVVPEAYFVPESTPLHTQLINFQRARRRIALVVDEYGDVQGLVTLEDILEEIVGEFTTDPAASIKEVHPQEDGTWLVDGSANIRELNKLLNWDLPVDGPKTLNGLILEHLEAIPEASTSLKIADYPIDILQVSDNAVKTARIYPSLSNETVQSQTDG
ncbi:HlyC/CorC family transporter [Sulfuriflexus mobilis]|uniref:HlyC/CorC family transporter n=1 Tax=Sulfuriflexus mobilis TaxID=1811807 RepID=UPI000F83CFF1|nr:HlyC/CorC family transporter [Sulfuriflexus mobilis]